MSLQDINNNYASDVENNQLEETDEQDVNINENNGLIDDDLNNIDFENIGMIPCEICQTMINFNDYSNHISICVRSYNLRRERFNILNGFLNILNESDNIRTSNNNISNNNNIISSEEDEGAEENAEENAEDAEEDAEEDADNELVQPYDQFIRNLAPLNTIPSLRQVSNIPLILPNIDNNIGRRLINDIEINIGNLHNLTYENNNTEYDFNLLIQQLMGGDVKIGIKDLNKILIPLKDEEINDNDICCICLDNLKNLNDNMNNQLNKQDKINIPVKTICNHLYCRECICKWLSKNKDCPVCKCEFEKDPENSEENNVYDEDIVVDSDNEEEYDEDEDDDELLPDLVSDTDSDYQIQL